MRFVLKDNKNRCLYLPSRKEKYLYQLRFKNFTVFESYNKAKIVKLCLVIVLIKEGANFIRYLESKKDKKILNNSKKIIKLPIKQIKSLKIYEYFTN